MLLFFLFYVLRFFLPVESVWELGNFQARTLTRGARTRVAVAESVPRAVLGEMGAARPV